MAKVTQKSGQASEEERRQALKDAARKAVQTRTANKEKRHNAAVKAWRTRRQREKSAGE